MLMKKFCEEFQPSVFEVSVWFLFKGVTGGSAELQEGQFHRTVRYCFHGKAEKDLRKVVLLS